MTKLAEKNRAIALREAGFSYDEISRKLAEEGFKVSKGSLSNWLKALELTQKNIERLLERERSGGQKGREAAMAKMAAQRPANPEGVLATGMMQ